VRGAHRGKATEFWFLPIQHFTPKNQTDAIYSRVLTEREQAQNATGTCKTKEVDLPKENAAADGPRNGVNTHKKRDISCAKSTPKRGANAMSLYADDNHKRAAKSLGYVLTAGTSDAWEDFVLILKARLTKGERQALAMAALVTLDDDTAYLTASMALFGVLDGEVLA
tara:strand:- start:491 stop:994 length:504 start_codon:yes stop_codon:yes gene_type:complete